MKTRDHENFQMFDLTFTYEIEENGISLDGEWLFSFTNEVADLYLEDRAVFMLVLRNAVRAFFFTHEHYYDLGRKDQANKIFTHLFEANLLNKE